MLLEAVTHMGSHPRPACGTVMHLQAAEFKDG